MKALPPDLQSGPFDRSGIPPNSPNTFSASCRNSLTQANGCRCAIKTNDCKTSGELAVGLEPTTSGLQNRGSAN